MKISLSILLSVFMLNTASANNYLDKVVDYVLTGDVQDLVIQGISSYHAKVSTPAEFVEVYSQQASAMANNEMVTVLVKRSEVSDSITSLQILLTSKVHPAIAKQIQALPATYAMHGDTGEPGRASLESSGLKEIAFEITNGLLGKKLAHHVLVDRRGYGLGNIYSNIEENAAIGIRSILEDVLIEQYVSRQNSDGTMESLNASIRINQSSELLNTFRIEMALPAKATEKQVKAVFQEVLDSIN